MAEATAGRGGGAGGGEVADRRSSIIFLAAKAILIPKVRLEKICVKIGQR